MFKIKKYFLLPLTFSIFLTGCSVGEYKEHMELGQEAFDEGNYKIAIEYFDKALNVKPNDVDAQQKLAKAKKLKFEISIKSANEAYVNLNYKEAIKHYEAAVKIMPSDYSDKDRVNLEETLLSSKQLAKKQTELNNYLEWVQPAIKKSELISQRWDKNVKQLVIEQITLEDFRNNMQLLMDESSQLKEEATGKSYELTGPISNLHSSYLKSINDVDDGIVYVLSATSPKKNELGEVIQPSISEIKQAGVALDNIQSNQFDHVSNLKSYAERNSLKFEFNLNK